MAQVKVEFSIGSLRFAGEGDQNWVESQLDKILDKVPTLSAFVAQIGSGSGAESGNPGATGDASFTASLASHIKAQGAEQSRVKRFLATADWLRRRGGQALTTAAVAKALSDNHQKRLANPADCLNQNVTKGLCEKKGDGFFITPDGLVAMGYK
jgi:hypothetical protein